MMTHYETLVKRALNAHDADERDEAFAELIQNFESVAYQWAYAALGDAESAQDAAQEAMITAYRCLEQLREPATFPGWLKQIVLSKVSRIVRRKTGTQQETLVEDEAVHIADDPAADPARSIEERERREAVQRAVAALSDGERAVTELFYFTGYSQQEIAYALGVPLTTVKKRLQYAREHLRERIPSDFTARLFTTAGFDSPEIMQSYDDALHTVFGRVMLW